ncbi:MAG: dihydroorotate dehydrogenase electron transfer subunit [Mycobacterium leprae]
MTGAWLQEYATVVSHTGQGEIYELVLRAPQIARMAVPGQFVEVRVTPAVAGVVSVDPLLRRPLSLARIRPDEGTITLIYRTVGRGTRLLAGVLPGMQVDLLGPLGRSFPEPTDGLCLVGGGLGIPPMVAAAEWAVAQGRQCTALIGARSEALLAGREALLATGVPVTVVTDDGSAGAKGLVTDPLSALLAAGQVSQIWACGPEPMLAAVKNLATAAGVPCYLSLERYMACGFGACIGCTVPKAGQPGYYRVCKDGPVFSAEEVELR